MAWKLAICVKGHFEDERVDKTALIMIDIRSLVCVCDGGDFFSGVFHFTLFFGRRRWKRDKN